MKEVEYDPLDHSAQRADARKFLAHMKRIVRASLQSNRISTHNGEGPAGRKTLSDRETLEWAMKNLRVFSELDKFYIAPRSPAEATHGYELLLRLMNASFYAGSRATITDSARASVTKDLHRAKSSFAGKVSTASRRKKQEVWATHVETRTLQIISKNRNISASDITTKLFSELTAKSVVLPGFRTVLARVHAALKAPKSAIEP